MEDSGAGAKPSGKGQAGDAESAASVEADLRRVARMFLPYRDDALMRELCRLAVRSVQEGWTRV